MTRLEGSLKRSAQSGSDDHLIDLHQRVARILKYHGRTTFMCAVPKGKHRHDMYRIRLDPSSCLLVVRVKHNSAGKIEEHLVTYTRDLIDLFSYLLEDIMSVTLPKE